MVAQMHFKRSYLVSLGLSILLAVVVGLPAAAPVQAYLPSQGNQLYHVWVSAPDDVFAVGETGTILHYDGKTWSPMNSGTRLSVFDVWGSSGSDVYAVGDADTILHYDGKTWSSMRGGSGG